MKSKKQLTKELEKSIVNTHMMLESKTIPYDNRDKIDQLLMNQIQIMSILENLLAE